LRHDTRLRSAERRSLKCCGDVTLTKLLAAMVIGFLARLERSKRTDEEER
jgi:hypothetical protein